MFRLMQFTPWVRVTGAAHHQRARVRRTDFLSPTFAVAQNRSLRRWRRINTLECGRFVRGHGVTYIEELQDVIKNLHGVDSVHLMSIPVHQRFQGKTVWNAVDCLRVAHSVAPDLLLTDVIMPQVNGIELAIQIRQLCPDCKVLLYSGQIVTNDLLVAASLDGHNFEILPKPVHPKDLLETIENLFEV
jgi:CheY-like chemotaxis protein